MDATAISLALEVGRMTAFELDVPMLADRLCAALPGSIGGAGAVIMLMGPDGVASVHASDDRSGWIGETQRRAESGPLPNAIRSGRSMLTADLTRVGPPELAAAAAESGLVSSLALPLVAGDQRLGGVQLLGNTWRPVEAGYAEAVQPLLDALAARLVDVRELRRPVVVAGAPSVVGATDVESPTQAVPPHVPVQAADTATVAIPLTPRPRPRPSPVPLPRSGEPPARHRRSVDPS